MCLMNQMVWIHQNFIDESNANQPCKECCTTTLWRRDLYIENQLHYAQTDKTLSVHKEVENAVISYYWNIHHNQSGGKVKQTQVAWLAFMFIQNLAQNFPKLCACNVKGQKSIIEAKLNQTSVLRLIRWNLVAPFTSYFQQTFENKHNIQQG